MKLFELYKLDEAFPINYSEKDDENWVASFDTPNDTIDISGTNMHGSGRWSIDFTGDSGHAATNKSASPKEAMATVFQFISELIASERPKVVSFSAAKKEYDDETDQYYDSARASIYARKANQMAKRLGYDVEMNDRGDSYQFMVTKNKEGGSMQTELPPRPKDREKRKHDKKHRKVDDTTVSDIDDIFANLGF